ncbi:MAG: hypothetical protein JWN72_866 [Thermoleophilia bacterium]|nr:hypothetical protein [Thermoleophilia bacterium]
MPSLHTHASRAPLRGAAAGVWGSVLIAAMLLTLAAVFPAPARAVNFGVSQNSDMLLGSSSYTERSVAQIPGVVGLWHFDTAYGPRTDSTANALTLTPVGVPTAPGGPSQRSTRPQASAGRARAT